MNTLHERLGVAVEADAARFSGEEFADAWGGDVAGRVKRRRQVRAAAYSGGTMLAAGALVLGGTKLPWGTVAGPAGPGGADDCVPASASPDDNMVYSESIDIEGGAASWDIPGRELEEATRYTLTYPSDRVERGVTVTSPDGTPLELEFDATGQATFVGEDGRVVVVTLSEGENSILTVVKSNATERQPSPTASVDCVTPTPSPAVSAMPSPSPSPSPSTSWPDAQDVSSPFQCGFEFPSPEGSTGVITMGEPSWQSLGAAEAAVRSLFSNPDSVQLALSGEEVPVLQYTSIATWPGVNLGGEVGATDPADGRAVPSHESDGVVIAGGYVDGAQFVLQDDDVVIATFSPDEAGTAGRTQFINPAGDGDGTLFGLNLIDGFTACPGVEPGTLQGAQAVAVAGTQVYRGETLEGPYYAWRYIERPE